jgi:hypothetical protein
MCTSDEERTHWADTILFDLDAGGAGVCTGVIEDATPVGTGDGAAVVLFGTAMKVAGGFATTGVVVGPPRA